MFPKRRGPSTSRREAQRLLVVAACLIGALAPASAQAAPFLNVSPSLQSATGTVAVGDVGQGQLTVMNHSTSPEDSGLLLLSELTLVPSCGAPLADPACTVAPGVDAGVISIDPAATGAGACVGDNFTATTAASGRVSFAPGSAVRLGTGASGVCVVKFTYTVQHVATKDTNGTAAGMQTDLVAFGRATASVNDRETIGVGYETVTVARDTPALITRASAAVPAGSQVSVAGTLAGTHPQGNITFELFGPADASCSGTPVSTSTLVVSGNNTYRSQSVVASQPGTYRWKASYGGDDDNDAVTSACGEPAASTVVSPPPPPPPPPPPATGVTPPSGGATTPGTGSTPGTGGSDPGTTKPPPTAVATAVRLDGFGLTRRTFTRASTSTALAATAAKATRKKAKKATGGTTIRYTVSAPATVTIVVERAMKGRRSGSKCVKATAKLKGKKSCTRYVKASTLQRVHTSAGAKKVRFSGRVGKRTMAYGTYRMRATARAGAGTPSAERIVTFKIVKR
jgi:hypothetical protein